MIHLLVVGLVGLAMAMGHPTSPGPRRYYHEAVGIKVAARLKAAESATDFTGSRVIGGSPSALGVHPYLAGLLITLQTGQLSVCSGALVSHTRVVTAGHCHFDGALMAQSYLVVLGTETLFTGGLRLQGSTVFLHPGYDWTIPVNDLALITIPFIGFSVHWNRITMPDTALMGNDLAGMYAQFSGFGVTSAGANIQPGSHHVQNHVWLPIISNAVCLTSYPELVFDSVLCTQGTATQSPCDGDTGGPLSVISGGQSILIGVNSFIPTGNNGCASGMPSGFTRITYFAFWINGNI